MPTDLEQSTGLERLEILGKMQGVDIFDLSPLDASRKGTYTWNGMRADTWNLQGTEALRVSRYLFSIPDMPPARPSQTRDPHGEKAPKH
jgi:hypothetical protein